MATTVHGDILYNQPISMANVKMCACVRMEQMRTRAIPSFFLPSRERKRKHDWSFLVRFWQRPLCAKELDDLMRYKR
jgi:hypothetical protein